MRFKEVYEKRSHNRLTVEQAADLLGIHERTFRRWSTRYEEEGAEVWPTNDWTKWLTMRLRLMK